MKYTIPGIPTLISFILWIFEKWLSKAFGPKMEKVPWGKILLLTFIFLSGIVYADLFNDNSQLREWIKERRKIANVEEFILAHKVNSEGSWYEAVIILRFLSRLENVSCTIEATKYVGLDHAQKSFVLKQEVISNTDENLIRKIPVAKFRDRESKIIPNGFWEGDRNLTWAGDGKNIVTLKLSSGLRRQSNKFLIATTRDVGAGPEPVILLGGPDSQSYLQVR